ncbi:MAG: SDR family oxidoreductase [Chloroflexi bacterium]|nr:SDR family oxidoreductase [Chloroflexota bacterium]
MWRKASQSSDQVFSTHGILQQIDIHTWQDHHFGLSLSRWSQLKGCAFWVTGAGTGYGRSITLALAAAGAQVFLTGRRKEKLQETLAEGIALGINVDHCIPVVADISIEADLASAVAVILQYVPHLHGLVNNAALPQPDVGLYPLAYQSLAAWSKLFETNVTAQWLTSRAALPVMARGDRIRILFMSSEAGWVATPGFGSYNISKSAVNALSASFAAECVAHFPNHDVQINVLVPGEARTEMNDGSTESPYSVVSMALTLLSHSLGGPNGCFFHRDGRHLAFAYSTAYTKDLLA